MMLWAHGHQIITLQNKRRGFLCAFGRPAHSRNSRRRLFTEDTRSVYVCVYGKARRISAASGGERGST